MFNKRGTRGLQSAVDVGHVFSTPLTRAHQLARQAVRLTKCGRLTEAISYHIKAAEELSSLIDGGGGGWIGDSDVIQSLTLQRDEQIKQHKILQHKVQVISEQRRQKKKKKGVMSSDQRHPATPPHPHGEGMYRLQQAELKSRIYETIEDTDSLLALIDHRGGHITSGSSNQSAGHNAASTNPERAVIKKPKSDAQIIEELRVNNSLLRDHISHLIQELEQARMETLVARGEADRLREQLQMKEGEPGNVLPPLEVPQWKGAARV